MALVHLLLHIRTMVYYVHSAVVSSDYDVLDDVLDDVAWSNLEAWHGRLSSAVQSPLYNHPRRCDTTRSLIN